MLQPEDCKVLYHFFRTSSEYISGYRSHVPYPDLSTYSNMLASRAASSNGAELKAPASHIDKPVEDTAPLAIKTLTTNKSHTNVAPSSVSNEENLNSLQTVYAAIAQCSACKLAATRIKPVAGEGPEELSRLTNSVDVMVIGEGPGADEDRQGRPFVGKAGQLLDKMLEAIQLSRKTNCYITNVVKCRPPQNRDPELDERSCCAPFLAAQIRLIRPKMILVMGRVAAQHLLQTSEGIGKLRGRFFEYSGIPLMPTYHPSALLRDERLKRPAWEDLKRFRAQLRTLQGYA